MSMYLANHPEFYMKAMDVGQSLAREYLDSVEKVIEKGMESLPTAEDAAKLIAMIPKG